MRFTDFLKATVLISAGAATALAAITVASLASHLDTTLIAVSIGWWVAASAYGVWLGRRAETSPPIARLLAGARTSAALPEVSPGRVLLNRLWPLLVRTPGLTAIYPSSNGAGDRDVVLRRP